jgi:hypothetical protein
MLQLRDLTAKPCSLEHYQMMANDYSDSIIDLTTAIPLSDTLMKGERNLKNLSYSWIEHNTTSVQDSKGVSAE